MSWPDREHYSCPLQSYAVSLLLSLVSTLLFSQTGDIPSHQNSMSHMYLQFPLRNLCSIVMLAVSSLEAFHYNTTNQSNHYVTELFEIKIDHTTQKLKSIFKKSSKLIKWFARYQHLYFGPSLGGALRLLNNFLLYRHLLKKSG